MFVALNGFQKAMLDELVMHPEVVPEAVSVMLLMGDFEPIKYIVNTHRTKFDKAIQTEMDVLLQEINRIEIAEAMAEREVAVVN